MRAASISGSASAVCDAGGRLIAFQRMDGAMWAAVYGSQGKAAASAAFGWPSGDLTERADHPTFRGIVAADGGRMILGRGAVPIVRDGLVIGACGVGGGTGEEDENMRARRRRAASDHILAMRAGVAKRLSDARRARRAFALIDRTVTRSGRSVSIAAARELDGRRSRTGRARWKGKP